MSQTLIIAEAGVNHNGDLSLAKELIDIAAESGSDIVKFQTFKASKLVTNKAPMADYQVQNTGKKTSQKELLESLELSFENHFELKQYSEDKGIEFLSTPFDVGSAKFLIEELKLKRIKVGSGLVNHAPYLHYIATTGVPVILSTGMCTISDITDALDVLLLGYNNIQPPKSFKELKEQAAKKEYKSLKDLVSILHCVTNYPCDYSEVNLKAMKKIKEEFTLPVGYSDHSLGIEVSCAAVAMGAKIIEKHYTLDKNLPGPDHKASLDADELKTMVAYIRNIELSLGQKEKTPTDSEKKNIPIVRMSLIAAEDITSGDELTAENISVSRPGKGLSPMFYWQVLGKKAPQNYKKGDYILNVKGSLS